MNLEDLDIDKRVTDIFINKGIVELYPPQAEALEHVLAGKSTVIAVPTASGKSLVAYMGILKKVLQGKKALYIVPLRALATEKYQDLKEFEPLGLKVGKTVGDFDAPEPELEKMDIIVATSERADSLLRHRSDWMYDIEVVVADEVHLINDSTRGPTMEVTMVKLKELNPRMQFIALSATIRNSIELADWLEARHVKSDWRPVALKEGIFFRNSIEFSDGTKRPVDAHKDELSSMVLDTVKEGGQIIIFVNTRRSSESVAERVGRSLQKIMGEEETADMEMLAEMLRSREEEPTSTGARLARCVMGSSAFHNAGLTDTQRRFIEGNFLARRIKCIVATPTLAAGINLPARRVVVRDTRRYDSNFGNVPIPVLEIKQMCGRAGRPQFDPFGEAVLVARNRGAKRRLLEDYILAETEAIRSKLGSEPALRTHILATIATGYARNSKELMGFIDKTFYAHQMDVWTIESLIEKMLDFLEDSGLIAADHDDLLATKFGKRTSDLYIDPLSAVMMKDAIEDSEDRNANELAILQVCSSTPDVYQLYLRKADQEWISDLLEANKDNLLLPVPDQASEDFQFFLSALKTAALIKAWMDETPENEIVEAYGVGPGDIRNRVESAEWMLYSMRELARLFGSPLTEALNPLVLRIRYGIKEELLPLASLKGIGRKRARTLHDAGFTGLNKLVEAPLKDLEELPGIGAQLAAGMKQEARRKLS